MQYSETCTFPTNAVNVSVTMDTGASSVYTFHERVFIYAVCSHVTTTVEISIYK